MPQRTLREAQEALDRLACSVQTRKQLQADLDAKKHASIEQLREYQARDREKAEEDAAAIKEELKSITKQMTQLSSEADELSASEYGTRYDELRARYSAMTQKAEQLAARLAAMQKGEEDPEGQLEEFHNKYPTLRLTFDY